MSAKYKGHGSGKPSKDRNSYSAGRRVFSLILAVLLLAAGLLVMYPEVLHRDKTGEDRNDIQKGVDKAVEKVGQEIDKLYSDENVQLSEGKLGLENFPMYGSDGSFSEDGTVYTAEGFYGVKNALEESKAYIKGDSDQKPDVGGLLKKISKSEGFAQALYSLALISLISIPVYMLLRLLVYDVLYDWSRSGFFIFTLPLRGIATLACGITSACISWVFYNTVLFDKLLKRLIEWISSLTASKAAEAASKLPSALAVNAGNIFALVIIIGAIIAMVRITVFRGNVGISIFLGLFRCLIFVVAFAFINVFIADWTWRVVLFGAVFVMAAGLLERIFDK